MPRLISMSDTPSPATDLANTLWLLGHSARQHVRDVVTATDDVDRLIRRALEQNGNIETVAASSFLDPDLIRHMQGGGSSLHFFLQNTSPAQPGKHRIAGVARPSTSVRPGPLGRVCSIALVVSPEGD